MTCCVCGKQQRSNSKIKSQWRAIQLDNTLVYACPNEFPRDGASKEAFSTAYQLVIACGLQELIERQGKEGDAAVALYRETRRGQAGKNESKGFRNVESDRNK